MELREIDKLVAEKIFDIKFCSCCEWADAWAADRMPYIACDACGDTAPFPKEYSSSVAEAWLVVEKLTEYEVKVSKRHTGEFECLIWSFTDVDTGKIWNSIDDSASLAICLAALRSKGIEI